MSCKYCYLGDKTSDSNSGHGCAEMPVYAVEKLLQAGVMPFNISLHGGEGREKQAHIMTHQISRNTLAAFPSDKDGYYCFDILWQEEV